MDPSRNGNSYFYKFGTPVELQPSGRLLLAGPLGDVREPDAKIFAFKHHTARLRYDPVSGRLLPVKSKVLWETGKPIAAFAAGAKDLGWKLAQGIEFVSSDRYLSLYHQVAPKKYALECTVCHGGTRMNFARLGYAPKTTRDGTPLCVSCHDREDDKPDFYEIHAIHPREEGINCKVCHKFSGTRAGWED